MRNVKNTRKYDKIISDCKTNPDCILYKTILDTSMDGFWIVDKDGNILDVNNAYCKMSGYRLDDYIHNKSYIKCKLISKGPKINLSLEKKFVLFHGVCELLTNVLKHANAAYIEVFIKKIRNSINISVKEKGIGFDHKKYSTSHEAKKGFGFFNLQERWGFKNGNLDIKNV